jgi:hypothetical protein
VQVRPSLALAKARGSVVVCEQSFLERLLDGEAGEGQRADHLEGKEADDVDGVVVLFEVKVGGKVEEISEALG